MADISPVICRVHALGQAEMLAMGSGGHLSRGYLRYIPIDKLDGLEPVPSNHQSDDGMYHYGQQIRNPIEVQYDAGNDVYQLFAGNHRVAQGKANEQTYILAFVEPDLSVGRDFIGTHPVRTNPDPLFLKMPSPARSRP